MRIWAPNLRCGKAEKIVQLLNRFRPELSPYEDVYKRIHQNPELSRQELQTSRIASDHLRAHNFSVHEGIGGYGVVGVLDNGAGRIILLRAELDALPVLEKTGLPYASRKLMVDTDGKEKPVMHACGHDMHIVALMGAAALLHAAKEHWQGRLLILFQPDEERGGGARAMVDDGLYGLEGVPKPDFVLGQHIVNNKVGTLQIGSGYSLAGKRTFRITIPGRGGHVGSPQDCIDPVITACHTVVRLQTIVSREIDPNDTAIVTCGSIRAGDTPNVIPDNAELTVDVRAYSPEVLSKAVQAVKRIVKAECDASGAEAEPEIREIEHVPPLINDPRAVSPVEEQFKAFFGEHSVEAMKPDMASDDFSILAPAGVPYSYWTLGSTDPQVWDGFEKDGRLHELPGNHSPLFSPVIEPTLKHGIEALSVAALTFLAT